MGDSYRDYLKGKANRPGAGKTRPRRTTAQVERAAAIREYQRKKSAACAQAELRLFHANAS